jgi:hydroxybutyrate-dimer hydrolase
MHRRKELLARLFAASLVSAALFGCGGGGSDSPASGGGGTLTGVAAEGRAIAKSAVSIRDANGVSRSVTTDAIGNFSFSSAGLAFPLMLKVTGSNGVYYTVVTSDDVANKRINISNFTNAVVQLALNLSDDSGLESSYGSGAYAKLTPAALAAADDAFKALLKDEFGSISGVTNVSPRFVEFTPASDDHDGDEVDRMLNLFRPNRGNGNSYISLNVVPERIRDITMNTYDGVSDDLLTAGLGADNLAKAAGSVAALAYADPTKPTAAELRRNAIYNNYRALVDTSSASGYGRLYGPNVDKTGTVTNGDGKIAGKEYIAYVDDGSGRKNVTVMVQIPNSFNRDKPCIVTGTSSGSRGIYGAIGTSGEWGLKNGCAVAYTDKGSGTGLHTFDDDTVNLRDGTRATATEAGKKSIFTAILSKFTPASFNAQYPNRIAFKHAYSQQNPEKDWGRNTLDAVAFAFYALNQEYGVAGDGDNKGQKRRMIRPANTIVIASSISNGGGAALQAAEQDRLGLIDGVAATEPQIQPRTSSGYTVQQGGQPVKTQGKPLYDYSSFAAIYQPCIAGIAGRCASLVEKGLLSGADLAAQQADARKRLMDYGWTADSDAFQEALKPIPALASFNANTNFLVTVTYANAYGRFTPEDKLCGFTFASTNTSTTTGILGEPIALSANARAQSFALQNGIIGNPVYEDSVGGARAYTLGVSPSTKTDANPAGRNDWSLDGVLCLRSLATGVDPVTGKALSGALADQSKRVRDGIAEVLADGNLRGKPAIIVAGRSDHLIPPNNVERAYLGLNATVEGAASKLRYVEVTNANHFDVLTGSVPGSIVPLHFYLIRALDTVYANLQGTASLPPSQVVRTKTRASATDLITADNVPAISASPAAANQITVSGTTVNVPD